MVYPRRGSRRLGATPIWATPLVSWGTRKAYEKIKWNDDTGKAIYKTLPLVSWGTRKAHEKIKCNDNKAMNTFFLLTLRLTRIIAMPKTANETKIYFVDSEAHQFEKNAKNNQKRPNQQILNIFR